MKIRIVLNILIVLLGVFIVNNYVLESYRVVGSSMEPTYKEGDLLINLKIKNDFARNDVVILEKNGRIYIKRIIGLPGERLEYRNNNLLINGNVVKDVYSDSIKDFETLVMDNSYFVLGDNRTVSSDSRDFGVVKKEEIIGKVIFKYFNFKGI